MAEILNIPKKAKLVSWGGEPSRSADLGCLVSGNFSPDPMDELGDEAVLYAGLWVDEVIGKFDRQADLKWPHQTAFLNVFFDPISFGQRNAQAVDRRIDDQMTGPE